MSYDDIVRYEKNRLGETELVLKVDVPTVNKYSFIKLPIPAFNRYRLLRYPLKGSDSFIDEIRAELDEFIALLHYYRLIEPKESRFHLSNLLYLIQETNTSSQYLLESTNRNKLLVNHLELANALAKEGFDQFDIKISDKLDTKFNYKFLDDPSFKNEILQYINDRILNDVANTKIDEGLRVSAAKTEAELQSKITSSIATTILKYISKETISLANTKNKEGTTLSVTDEQGDFIYDVMTLFQIYKPKIKSRSDSNKRHHDAIRKLIKRAADK